LHCIGAFARVLCNRIECIDNDICVVAGAAGERIRAGTAIQRIIAATADQCVVSGEAVQNIVTLFSGKGIVS